MAGIQQRIDHFIDTQEEFVAELAAMASDEVQAECRACCAKFRLRAISARENYQRAEANLLIRSEHDAGAREALLDATIAYGNEIREAIDHLNCLVLDLMKRPFGARAGVQ